MSNSDCHLAIVPIFDSPAAAPGTERFDVLFEGRGVRIERITSSGSQPRQFFTQLHDEWVLLAHGTATLRVGSQLVLLKTGDSVHIPANVTHELLETSENAVWVAVHVIGPT
jgi:cupin 2 domain-containing protein